MRAARPTTSEAGWPTRNGWSMFSSPNSVLTARAAPRCRMRPGLADPAARSVVRDGDRPGCGRPDARRGCATGRGRRNRERGLVEPAGREHPTEPRAVPSGDPGAVLPLDGSSTAWRTCCTTCSRATVPGALHATTHEGIDGELPLPHPEPPRREIDALIKRFLGSRRRAGQGILPDVSVSEPDIGSQEAVIYGARASSARPGSRSPAPSSSERGRHRGERVLAVECGATPVRRARHEFEAALRQLLAEVSPDGFFSEQMRETAVDVWRV